MAGPSFVSVELQHQNRLVREMLASHLVRRPGVTLVGTDERVVSPLSRSDRR